MICMQGVGSATKELGDESLVASGLRSVGRGFTTLEQQLTSASGKGQAQVGLRLAFGCVAWCRAVLQDWTLLHVPVPCPPTLWQTF